MTHPTDAAAPHVPDPVLEALDELLRVARDNIVSWVGVMERVEAIRELRRDGTPYTAMQISSPTPPIIDAVSRNQERLGQAAANFRRTMAQTLVAEGMSHADIARAFGVSRQRVGMLLRPGDGHEGGTTSDSADDAEPATDLSF